MQDYFTKWPEAIPLKDLTTKSVAGVLLSVISTWGPPAGILCIQGPEFMGELNCELSRQQGIKRQYATAYHPQQVDQFNGTLKAMIAKFMNGRQDNWDVYLPATGQPCTSLQAHSLCSYAGQGTTKQGWSGKRVDSDG